MNIEDDVLSYFIDKGFANSLGDDLTLNLLPETDSPDNLITVFTYANSPQSLALNDFEYNFQCRVRDVDYTSCRDRIVAIHSAMYRQGVTIGGRRIIFKARQSPAFLLFDDANRTHFVFNFSATTTGY